MKSNLRLVIVSIVGLVLFGTCAFFLRNLLFGDVVATYEEAALDRSSYSDQWISYEVSACLGCYAEGTETYGFIPTGHEYYYMIWMTDGSIMPISVSKKADRQYLDALSDATYDYLYDNTKMIEMEPRTFIGTVTSQDSEVRGYYVDALDYLEISEEEGWVVRDVLLDCTKTRANYILLVGIVLMIPVGGIVLSVVGANKEKKKKLTEEESYLPR